MKRKRVRGAYASQKERILVSSIGMVSVCFFDWLAWEKEGFAKSLEMSLLSLHARKGLIRADLALLFEVTS